jgi:hypothetical protein
METATKENTHPTHAAKPEFERNYVVHSRRRVHRAW